MIEVHAFTRVDVHGMIEMMYALFFLSTLPFLFSFYSGIICTTELAVRACKLDALGQHLLVVTRACKFELRCPIESNLHAGTKGRGNMREWEDLNRTEKMQQDGDPDLTPY